MVTVPGAPTRRRPPRRDTKYEGNRTKEDANTERAATAAFTRLGFPFRLSPAAMFPGLEDPLSREVSP
jgi:hypothetical protein